MGNRFEPASPIQTFVQDQLTVVEFTVSELANREDVQSLRDDLDALLADADVGVVVDCESVTGRVNSFLLGALIGVAKAARRARKEFAVCGLQGTMKSAYELARISSEVPAYEDAASAIASLGIPDPSTMVRATRTKPVRRDLTKAPKRSKSKARKESKAVEVNNSARESSFDFEEQGGKLAVAGGLFALAMLVIFGWSYGSTLFAMIPSSASEIELTLTGRVSYMNRGQVADDGGALVVVWPQGARPRQGLTVDDLSSLSDGASDESQVFATRTDSDGSYTIQIQGKTKAELLNVLVVSNNLKEKSADSSSLSSLEDVFVDPTEVVGKRGHELGFVVVESSSPKHDVMLSPRYVVQ